MANDANVTIFGNLVRDPERKKVGNNDVCSFTVAVRTDTKKDKNSEEYDSNFYDCSLWGAERIKPFMDRVQKGTYVYVSGPFCQAEYTGADKTVKHRLRLKVIDWKALAKTKDSGRPSNNSVLDAAAEPQFTQVEEEQEEDSLF